jgi:hypothetical protein
LGLTILHCRFGINNYQSSFTLQKSSKMLKKKKQNGIKALTFWLRQEKTLLLLLIAKSENG